VQSKLNLLFKNCDNDSTSVKVKALQEILTPELAQPPSSQIQIAKVKGVKYISVLLLNKGTIFLPFL
jgi:hypothetical protein